ncbi:HutD/Ves family protein [Simiduia aestuariiviva]|uniref:HutD family protein n=1 Tax=Simiduia aestuariiviva TaxID=1510459 RepID=A0A839UW64_9GAMM|nr:HutD family protein [Simiduia aestuariiviva]MBB3169565.1 hypothetical protein [Simiduia aestuariiviva]
MFDVIGPEEFNKIPWKNGKGETLELAISAGHTLQSFDWRISIAQLEEDGYFSDFAGYHRTLILLEGNGLELSHEQGPLHRLTGALPQIEFDGGLRTFGRLLNGPVTDLNITTKSHKFQAIVETHPHPTRVKVLGEKLCFAYSHRTSLTLRPTEGNDEYTLPAGHLLKMENTETGAWTISGEDWTLIYLTGY